MFGVRAFAPIVALGSVLSASAALACECIDDRRPVEVRLRELPPFLIVVSGRATQVKREPTGDHRFLLVVDQAWQNVTTPTLVLESSPYHCGYSFQEGQDYLVIAVPVEGRLVVSPCSPTMLLRDARPFLPALGAPAYVPPRHDREKEE